MRLTAAILVLLVGCGGDDPPPSPTPPTAVTPPSAAPTPATEPVAASVDALRQRISVDPSGGCALRADGVPVCWGTYEATRAITEVGPFVDVVWGGYRACGRTEAGAIQCWSRMVDRVSPLSAPAGEGYTDLGLASESACAIREGSVTCVNATGSTTIRGLTDAVELAQRCVRRAEGSVACFHDGVATPLEGLSEVHQIDGDAYTSCALHHDAQVTCWGADLQALRAPDAPRTTTVEVPSLAGATVLRAGGGGVCGRMATGWTCTGNDVAGRFGFGTTSARREAIATPTFATDTELALGQDVACSVRGDEVRCLGLGDRGALGSEARVAANQVHQVLRPASGAERATDLLVFGDAACARIGDHFRCWGEAENDGSSMGLVERARHRRLGPTPMGAHGRVGEIAEIYDLGFTRCSLSTEHELHCQDARELRRPGVRSVASGEAGVCLVLTNGALECPRLEGIAPLFEGTEEREPSSGVLSVGLGTAHACLARESGPVACAFSSDSDLGWIAAPEDIDDGGDEGYSDEPAAEAREWIDSEESAVEVVSGMDNLCARTAEGRAWCVGGEAGNAPQTFVERGAVALVGGLSFGCALVHLEGVPDEVRCASYDPAILGRPMSDELDFDAATVAGLLDGLAPAPVEPATAPDEPTAAPVPLEPVAPAAPHWGIVEIGAGSGHVCALRSDGAVYCWGDDSRGQVGRTPSTLHLEPVIFAL